jgi:hypothetical protein
MKTGSAVLIALVHADRLVQCDMPPLRQSGPRCSSRSFTRSPDPAVGAAGYDPKSGYCVSNAGDLFAPGMQGSGDSVIGRIYSAPLQAGARRDEAECCDHGFPVPEMGRRLPE